MNYFDIAASSIENFSMDEAEYTLLDRRTNIVVHGLDGKVFLKQSTINSADPAIPSSPSLYGFIRGGFRKLFAAIAQLQRYLGKPRRWPGGAKIKIYFGKTKGCKVFIGENIRGDMTINFRGNDSIIYIGSQCYLNKLEIRSLQDNDFIAIGNGVTTTNRNVWISGNGAGNETPAIIIGDDCMFSYDVVVRNSDAHPIFDAETDDQINEPTGIVHIEPHVWICEQVNILKSTTIGACSIIALGSVVTKDVPRFSIASGVPAISRTNENTYWARSDGAKKEKAKEYYQKYKNL